MATKRVEAQQATHQVGPFALSASQEVVEVTTSIVPPTPASDTLNEQATIDGRPLASYPNYPIVELPSGQLGVDAGRAEDLVDDLIDEKNVRAIYELLYLDEGLRSDGKPVLPQELKRNLLSHLPSSVRDQYTAEWTLILQELCRVVHGLGETFDDCGIEFVVHDVRNPLRSVVCIANTISDRQLHSPNTNFGLRLIKKYAADGIAESFSSYKLAINDRSIKSSTIPIIDRYGNLVAFLCINMDISWAEQLPKGDANPNELPAIVRALSKTRSTAVDELIALAGMA